MMDPAYGFSGLRARKGRPLLERLMERVIPVPWSGCWLWTGGLYSRGYGMAFLPGGKPITAHRAMLIAQGIPLKLDDVVRHTCDVRCCVNPDHLLVGTQADNMDDMNRRGRHVGANKIPAKYRELIRAESPLTPAWALAAWFGVSQKTIRNIRNGITT